MSTKTVYQTDPDGWLVGLAVARESPLEPGVWHLPAGCVEAEPPALADGERTRWVGDDWVIVPPSPTPEEAPATRDELVEHARFRRLQAEGIGVVVAGITYASDIESQVRLEAKIAYLNRAGLAEVTWKSRSGMVVLTLGELEAVALAVAEHTQQCFDAEAAVINAINHGDITTLAQVEDAASWPGSSGGEA